MCYFSVRDLFVDVRIQLPNFVKGLAGLLKENSPENITERDYLGFMDAGGSSCLQKANDALTNINQ